MASLVSILIPAYNAQAWIAETIRSALGQVWHRKELIVVDDGSSDQTLAIARQFACKDVAVVRQPNAGASAARNKAFELCQGDYIQWLDADDLLAPDKIARQMDAAHRVETGRTLFSAAWGSFMYRVSKAQFQPTPLWCDLPPVEWLLRKMGQNLHMQTATWLVSRELTAGAGPWDTRLSLDDDGEYFCRVLLASKGVRFVTEAKVFYRASGAARLSKVDFSDKKLESQFLSMQLHLQYLRSIEDSERARRACINYLQTWLPYFVPERRDLAERLENLAMDLGGRLQRPTVRPKYVPVAKLFGYAAAKRAQNSTSQVKWHLIRKSDKLMWHIEQLRRKASAVAPNPSETTASQVSVAPQTARDHFEV